MIKNIMLFLMKKTIDFRKWLIAFLVSVAVLAFIWGHVIPMKNYKKDKVLLSSCIDENQMLKQLCENEKFEEKWLNIAKEQKKKKGEMKNEDVNSTFFDDDTIYF